MINLFWNLLLVCLYAGIIITIHEMGHYIAARSVNTQPDLFEIGKGPVIWRQGIWTFRLIFVAGGRVNHDDNIWDRLPQKHRNRIALGGPIASVVSGLVALSFIPLYGYLSLISGFGNMIPFRVGQGYTDGGYVLHSTTQIWGGRLIFGALTIFVFANFTNMLLKTLLG